MKTKFVQNFESAMKKLLDDIGRNQVRFYRTNEFPGGFPGFPPTLLKKCTSVTVAVSACSAEQRDYMLIASNRVDWENKGNGYCYDMDPFIGYFDSDTGEPCRTGIVYYHGKFPGRSEPVKESLEYCDNLEEAVATLKDKVISSCECISQVDPRIKEAMNFMASVFRSEVDGEEV
jgi:hypothetical protein